MYLDSIERDKLIDSLEQKLIYTYIKRINYIKKSSSSNDEDFLGITVHPELYLGDIVNENNEQYYANITIIRNRSYNVCNYYLHNVNQHVNIENNRLSYAAHTLFIVKEIAFVCLEYMDLMVRVDDPRLVKVYFSRKGFGNKIHKVAGTKDLYRVFKTTNNI